MSKFLRDTQCYLVLVLRSLNCYVVIAQKHDIKEEVEQPHISILSISRRNYELTFCDDLHFGLLLLSSINVMTSAILVVSNRPSNSPAFWVR